MRFGCNEEFENCRSCFLEQHLFSPLEHDHIFSFTIFYAKLKSVAAESDNNCCLLTSLKISISMDIMPKIGSKASVHLLEAAQ